MPVPPGLSQKDADQVLRAVMDDDTNRLRVDATVTAVLTDIEIRAATGDNIAITNQDGTNPLVIEADGSINTNTTIVGGELAVEISAADGDNIAISSQDGANKMSVNADGSINVTDSGGSLTVDQGTTPWVISGNVNASQAGTWNINNITGTVSLPTGAATEAKQDVGNASLASIDSKLTAPITVTGTVTANAGTGNFTVVQPSGANLHVDVDNFPATQSVTQGTTPWVVSGTVTTSPNVNIHDSAGNNLNSTTGSLNVNVTNTSVSVTQGTTPWVSNVNNGPGAAAVNIQDGGNSITVDGTVAATQSGTWNINNITGTVSLPTGAATEATLATRLADSTFTGRINTQGQKAMSASTPVVIASDQSPLVATSSSVTTFNATTTNATVLAANPSRKGASFYNDGGGVIYLKLGATASSTSYTVRMPDNTFYELPYPVYTGTIDAVSQAGTRSLRVTELT